MKKKAVISLVALLLAAGTIYFVTSNMSGKSDKIKLITEKDKLSYSLGMVLGERFKADFDDLDLDVFKVAIETVYQGGEPLLNKTEVQQVMQDFEADRMAQRKQLLDKRAQENLEQGKAYLAENAKKSGVKVTASGLQYEIIKQGKGKKPKATDTVKVHYKGTLISGSEFDSSYSRGEPVSFPLNGVIAGWTEGLQLLSVGSKARFVIPSDLAYGDQGSSGGMIGPKAALIFEVELLEILAKEK